MYPFPKSFTKKLFFQKGSNRYSFNLLSFKVTPHANPILPWDQRTFNFILCNSKNLSIPASLASVFTPLANPFIIIKSIFIPPGGWIRFYSNPRRHVGSALGSLRYQRFTAIWHMLLIKYSLIFQRPVSLVRHIVHHGFQWDNPLVDRRPYS